MTIDLHRVYRRFRCLAATVLFGALALILASAATAAPFPDRPIKLIVPYSAGGPSDLIARLIAQKASEILGVPIVVDNRGGAGGVLGTTVAAKASPDGYTTVMVSPGQVGIAAGLRPNLPYDPMVDLVPVVALVEDTLILGVSNKLPVSNVKELIEYMKAHPGQLNYSSAGVGSITHLTAELFLQQFGLRAVHVPFKGSGESMLAVVTGEVNWGFASPSGMVPLLRDPKLRGMAIASSQRSSVVPEVPTMAAMGFANLESPLYYVLAVPKGTPDANVQKLYHGFSIALQDPTVVDKLTTAGVQVVNGSPDVARATMAADVNRWKALGKTLNIRLE